jgi:maltooligosyltrehalose trehalohydrolase
VDRLGVEPLSGGGLGVCVWAPAAAEAAIRVGGRDHALSRADGLWAGVVPGRPGDDYWIVLDGTPWPDPWSRRQPEGVRGPSRVVDTSTFRPAAASRPVPPLDELVLYELHVGTFSEKGTFAGIAPHLHDLRALGVTAIELMPVATFAGARGWGYDGLYAYAPHEAYGGPDGLAGLVAGAHAAGLGVVLDVVYNHVGAGAEALRAYGPWFTERLGPTPWGDALDYGERAVREWAIQNAELWVRDYGVDGLRLDAVHALHDDSPVHVLAELAERVHAVRPGALVISEMGIADFRPLREWGHDAMWLDGLHHALHVALTGERDGYYAELDGSLAAVAAELQRPEGPRLVVFAQNHDQVGNRAVGDRLSPAKLRVAAAAVLFSPFTPLLFQGEEYGEQRPFQFFSDHIDPAIATATREGRRREFAGFAGFVGEVPDPQATATFRRSKLDPAAGDPEQRAFYRRLLELRRELPRELEVDRVDEAARTLELRRGRARMRLDFANETVELDA